MGVTVKPKDLAAALVRVKPAVGGNYRGDVLTYMVRLEASDDELCVSADNGDMRISTLCGVGRTEDLDVCVPYTLLVRLAKVWKYDMTMSVDSDGRLAIEQRRTNTTFTTAGDVRTAHYQDKGKGKDVATVACPPVRRSPDAETWLCDGHVLRSMKLATPSAAGDVARPVLGQVHLDPSGYVVATDSYRCAIMAHDPTTLPPEHLGIPVGAIRAIPDMTGEVLVTYDHRTRYLELACDSGVTITTRTVDGDFPNWQGLVPRDGMAVVVVDVAHHQAMQAWKTGKAMANGSVNPTYFTWDPDEASFRYGVAIRDEFDYEGRLPGEDRHAKASKEVRVAFNPDYFLDSMAACGSGVIRIEIIDNLKPARLSDPDGNRSCLLMPVRIG